MTPIRRTAIAVMWLALATGMIAQVPGGGGPPRTDAAAPGGRKPTEKRLPDIPDSLDETISAALRANPDVILAEAKLRQAEAELSQVRLKVAREVIALHNQREKQRIGISEAQLNLERIAQAGGAGAVSQSEILTAKFTLQKAQMDLSQLETGLRYMLASVGSSQPGGMRGSDPFSDARGPAPAEPKMPAPPITAHRPEIPQALAEGPLSMKITPRFKDAPLTEVLEVLTKTTSLPFVIHRVAQEDSTLAEAKITNPFNEPVTLAAFIRMMTDQFDLMFVFREYGVLVTTPGYGESMQGPAIPNTPQIVR